ncbi:Mitochondrial import receptor subunit tom40 [Vanrija pseudolonga]|uniref:Mitochondrial import receptor subunit tom40 n=1 Tax=Vanrija pseudolonga TaxID=143232 RepID=A0AAF0Y8N5_9TREE|nr:Mitochondrial import receptor subunit tom40 [Vanrija pseudolonga]
MSSPLAAASEKLSAPAPHEHAHISSPYTDFFTNLVHPVAQPLAATFERFHNFKEYYGLVQPGTVEGLTRDVNNTLMSNYFFEGARADLSKVVSPNPAFQITHSFQLGQKSNYTLGTVFANANTFLHGQWDPSTGGVNMRANQTWSASDITKIQGQLSSTPGQTMFQIEHDHIGPHYSLNLKSINPSPLDGTGLHFVSLIHSVSPRLALGFESIIQRTTPNDFIPATSYLLKYTSSPDAATKAESLLPPAPGTAAVPTAPFTPSWAATAQLQPSGNIQATYFHKLSDKVDVALDLQTMIQPASFMGPAKRDALASLGAKYEFRMATFRGQIDSAGKVGMLLEQRFTPAFAFLVGGEIDHAKNTSRFGVGVMIESSTMTPEEMVAAGMIPPQ